MLKSTLTAVLLLGLAACHKSGTTSENEIRYDTIHYAPEYYAQRVAEFSTEPLTTNGIVFLGNSIIEYADWAKLLNDSTVVNRGIAADNTFGVLNRLDEVISRAPSKLFIEIGINDISQNIPDNIIVDNILTIMESVHEASTGTRLYFISILPTNDNVKNEYPDAFNKNQITDRINSRLKQASEGLFTYVDLNAALRNDQGQLNEKYATPDGLHLNDEGYAVFMELLRGKL